MSGRWIFGRLGAAAALLVCAAAPARAQSPDADRQGIRVGPFELRPRLSITNAGIDNNVFNERVDPKRDFTFMVAPELEVALHPGRLRVAYTSGSEFVYFRKYVDERSVNRNFGGRVDLDLTLVKPFVSFSTGETSARPNAEIDARARHRPRVFTAGTRLKVASRTEMVLTAREASDVFDDSARFRGVPLARTLDETDRSYDAALNVALTPITTAGLVVTRETQRFARSPVRDADSWKIAPTLTFSPLGLVTGSGSVGYRAFNGLDPSLPDYSGIVAAGAIGIQFVGRYKLDTSFTRDIRYSYEELVPYYLLSGVRSVLAAQAIGMLELRLLGGRESMDYRAAGGVPALPVSALGSDTLTSYGGGAGYRLGDRARIVVDVEFLHRASTRDLSREYSNHRIVASLTWGALNR